MKKDKAAIPEGGSFLKLLNLDICEISEGELVEPKGKMEAGDVILGVCSDVAKRIYTRWQQYDRAAAELKLKIHYDQGNEPDGDTRGKWVELHSKGEFYKALFWLTLNEEHNGWNKSMGIRQEWTVVQPQDPIGMIRKFFEG